MTKFMMNEDMMYDESLGEVFTYNGLSDRILKTRKVNRLLKDQICSFCDETIVAGSKATYISGLSGRKFYQYYTCEKCRGE
jgi:hypothetical protein